jgi:hypothetical protein
MKPLFGADSGLARSRAAATAPGSAQTNGGGPRPIPPVPGAAQLTAAHPEIYVAGAFAAGVVLAIAVRRLGH